MLIGNSGPFYQFYLLVKRKPSALSESRSAVPRVLSLPCLRSVLLNSEIEMAIQCILICISVSIGELSHLFRCLKPDLHFLCYIAHFSILLLVFFIQILGKILTFIL